MMMKVEQYAFLAMYDSIGNLLWNTTWGGIDQGFGEEETVEGVIYSTGATTLFGVFLFILWYFVERGKGKREVKLV